MVRLVAGAEEAAPLGESGEDRARPGTPQDWPLSALIAHSTEFKSQQVVRLRAVLAGETRPSFAETDHTSSEIFHRFARPNSDQVLAGSLSTTAELVHLLWDLPDSDLTDPGRNPWLHGRQLWLQVVVRGFWHPGGHLGEHWLSRGQGERALRLHGSAVALAEAVRLPRPALGMARYALACAMARVGRTEDAMTEVTLAVSLNSDLVQNAARDPDLAPVRALPGWTRSG